MHSWEALIHVCCTLSPLVLEHMGTSLLIPIPASPCPIPCLSQCGCGSRFTKQEVFGWKSRNILSLEGHGESLGGQEGCRGSTWAFLLGASQPLQHRRHEWAQDCDQFHCTLLCTHCEMSNPENEGQFPRGRAESQPGRARSPLRGLVEAARWGWQS